MPSSFFYFLLSTSKLSFSVAMISGLENHKILVETRDENIEIESIPSVFQFFLGGSVRLQIAPKKHEFDGVCLLR